MVFIRLRRGLGDSAGTMGSALGVLDALVNPAAARARAELDAQNERVIPAPSPGDRLLNEAVLVVQIPGRVDRTQEDPAH